MTDLPSDITAHPAYVEGFQAGLMQGRSEERARIQSVEAQSLPGHQALINTLKYDGVSTAADAAMRIVAAEKAVCDRFIKTWKEETPLPVSPMLSTDK